MFSKFYFLIISLLFCTTAIAQPVIIQMEKNRGIWEVPCKLNGIPMKFIFDTGASQVSISMTEALFLLKNGHLNKEDILGTNYSSIANGDIVQGSSILIRELDVANLKLYNVRANIIHTENAPLLLGGSALEKLGTYQIDPNKGVLTILNGNNYDFSINQPQEKSRNSPRSKSETAK